MWQELGGSPQGAGGGLLRPNEFPFTHAFSGGRRVSPQRQAQGPQVQGSPHPTLPPSSSSRPAALALMGMPVGAPA